MSFRLDGSDQDLQDWLAKDPSEAELRDAYVRLEAKRAALWTDGHHDSFHRDRYDRDANYVRQLVHIKFALARHWARTGQFDGLDAGLQLA